MKSKYELSPEETIALIGFAERALDRLFDMIEESRRDRMHAIISGVKATVGARPPSASEQADPGDEACDPVDGDGDAEADIDSTFTEIERPTLRVVSDPGADEALARAQAAFQAVEQDRIKVLHGRDVWLALIEMWRENFGVTDAPQPDRVATLTRILHMDGKAVFAYLKTKDGLTHATRDVLCEMLQRPLDNAVKREARLLAENIAQVCSFHAPDIADRLEYSSEYHIIPE